MIFFDALTSIQDINQKTQSPQKFMPGKLKRSGFLSGCFHFHKSNSTAGHQYDAIWNACRSGRREFPTHTAILLYCLCEFFFNDFFLAWEYIHTFTIFHSFSYFIKNSWDIIYFGKSSFFFLSVIITRFSGCNVS